jgi:hypothetical protein
LNWTQIEIEIYCPSFCTFSWISVISIHLYLSTVNATDSVIVNDICCISVSTDQTQEIGNAFCFLTVNDISYLSLYSCPYSYLYSSTHSPSNIEKDDERIFCFESDWEERTMERGEGGLYRHERKHLQDS